MLTNTDLVTITCTRDRGIQELQSYSLDLMVAEPCNHYVVVEDNKITIEEWRTMLSPYYTRHHLHLIPGTSLLPSEHYVNDSQIKNGWHRQEVLKLLMANKIQSEKYLILDSKNFFVRQQSVDDWPVQDGNGIIEKYDSRSWDEINDFCLIHNIPIPINSCSMVTPFMANTNLVKKIIRFDILPLFFNKKDWWSCEFLLYSIFSQSAGIKLESNPTPNVTFWNTERELIKEVLKDIYDWPDIRMFGLHRDVLKLGTDLTELINFLVEIGFDKNIVATTLTQYEQDIRI